MATSTAPKIHPLGDKVVIERLEAEEKTKGGIVLPDTAKEKPQKGKVVAVGKGAVNDDGKLIEPSVKVGDTVIFRSYAGSEVTLAGKEYIIMSEEEILATIA